MCNELQPLPPNHSILLGKDAGGNTVINLYNGEGKILEQWAVGSNLVLRKEDKNYAPKIFVRDVYSDPYNPIKVAQIRFGGPLSREFKNDFQIEGEEAFKLYTLKPAPC